MTGTSGPPGPAAAWWLPALLPLLLTVAPAVAGDPEPLRFRIEEGRNLNAFYRQGEAAAHLLLTSGERPRVLVAFPAGNSGVGLWFEDTAAPVRWTLGEVRGIQQPPAGAASAANAPGSSKQKALATKSLPWTRSGVAPTTQQPDREGRPLHGIVAEASVDATRLVVRDAVLGSVRTLRDFQLGVAYPAELATRARVGMRRALWSRPRLDGAPGYALTVELLNGRVSGGGDAPLTFTAERNGEPLRLRITALTGERPLTPLPAEALFSAGAGDDLRSREALEFLSYREKFLAGSWRFDTYFGRDTLMSLRLLMPALRPDAIEDGLASVLERLDAGGEVAHEEDIGEFAVLRHRKEGTADAGDAPIYDYKMVDDDLMLAPVAAAWLLDSAEGRARAAAFLARNTAAGEALGAALARNFAFVVAAAQPFAREPVARNLIPLKPGVPVGQWRDSEHGLAGGRYAYDVNAVFAPAALEAIARFAEAGLLQDHASATQREALATARALADAWSRQAPPLFEVAIDGATARDRVSRYAGLQGVDAAPALASLPRGQLRFAAVALDAAGKPLPVLHSDGGFALLFRDPAAQELDALVEAMMRPFPAGLLTGVGLLVANPAYADAGIGAWFGRNAYHGAVVWSWQQALLAAGLARQLQRDELPEPTRGRLLEAQRRLWQAIDATAATRTSELWSWSYADGRYRVEPFGQDSGDADESNAAQLWSTVYLAIPHP